MGFSAKQQLQFNKDRELELKMSPYFDEMYKQVYHESLRTIQTVSDYDRQMSGIDKILYFKDGRIRNIDEKTLKEDRGNFILEEYSHRENGDKGLGWLEKGGMKTNYLIYGYWQTKEMFIIPYYLVRAYYFENKDRWLRETKRIHGKKSKDGVGYYENKEKNDYTVTGFYVNREQLCDGIEEIYRKLYGKEKLTEAMTKLWRIPKTISRLS